MISSKPNKSELIQIFQNLSREVFIGIRNSIREKILEIERIFDVNSKSEFEVTKWYRNEFQRNDKNFGYEKNYQNDDFDIEKLDDSIDRHLDNHGRVIEKNVQNINSNNNFGGGEISIIRGNVFDKMGVNFANVWGNMPKYLDNSVEKFWACGVSLVAHPKNPFVPAIHMNIRMMVTEKNYWFGGGIDLNPVITNDNETIFFHKKLKEICDKYNNSYYKKFSNWCDDYFQLQHRNSYRGVGGIFFDKLGEGDVDGDEIENIHNFIADLGGNFNEIYGKIVYDNIKKKYGEKELESQRKMRRDYAEFNLLYDRGIKFGLQTGGNVDGMFMSLPPEAFWY